MGFIFGPMIGGLLGGVDLRLPFYAAAALSLINAAYGYFVVPESLPTERRTAFSLARANPLAALLKLLRHQEIGRLVVVFALSTAVRLRQYGTVLSLVRRAACTDCTAASSWNRPIRPRLLARCNNRSASSIAVASQSAGSCSDSGT